MEAFWKAWKVHRLYFGDIEDAMEMERERKEQIEKEQRIIEEMRKRKC